MSNQNRTIPNRNGGALPAPGYDPATDSLLVSSGRDPFRDVFPTLNAARWDTVQTGAGMAVTVAGVLNGSRYLNVNTGITANSETILLSKDQFRIPMRLLAAVSLSQRIANQEFLVELVEVDANGAVITDASIVAAPNVKDARNAVAILWNGTGATGANMVSRADGTSELSAAVTLLTTVATGTGPNFIPAAVFELAADYDELVIMARATDSSGLPAIGAKRTQALPAPDREYKVRLRVRNLGTAPASATDFRVHLIQCEDMKRVTVDWKKVGGRSADLGNSMPVILTGPNPAGTAMMGGTRPDAQASGTGRSVARLAAAAASINATVVKGSAGRLFSITGYNAAAAVRYLKVYNKATVPAPATDNALILAVYRLQPSAPFNIDFGDVGLNIAAGLSYALTTGTADTDATAVTAGDIEHMAITFI